MIWLILLAILAAGVWFWFFYLDHRTPAQVMEAEDGDDPARRWARGAYAMLNGKYDPGNSTPGAASEAKGSLARDWEVADAESARRRLAELAAEADEPAWTHVRRIVLARRAAAAGYLPQPESWAAVAESRSAAQSAYDSWDALHAAYRARLAAWDSGRLDQFDFWVKEAARPIWAVVPFK